MSSLDALRLAIISNPRSGNTWLRKMLAASYEMAELAVHHPNDISWHLLPARLVLQIHWHRSDDLVSLLAEQGFRVVVLARHPLDVLISILHFANYEPDTASWLKGEGGTEISILEKTPLSPEFINYATGSRAAALLSISSEWWRREDTLKVRYENLVNDAVKELSQFNEQLDLTPVKPILDVVSLHSIDRLRTMSTNNHFWQGKYALWKKLLTAPVAQEIALAHQSVLAKLEYVCNADPTLTEEQAIANWNAIAVKN
ncbi:MAG: sulfotransferase domain-containing protein [Nostoc sp.]|uniref:sulfotransferase domain-containing protein n=1 Tax=Nostoc sp. TaxID=1180 RepID=UPI002FF920C4